MPETRLAKTRRSLPEGYQFGDAGRQWYERSKPLTQTPGSFGPMWRIGNIFGVDKLIDRAVVTPCFDSDRDPGDETPTRRLRRREA